MSHAKIKLWELLIQRNLVSSRQRAEALILAGKVRIGGERARAAGQIISPGMEVTLCEEELFAGRGGYKLMHALTEFEIPVTGRICADVGSSVGGFVDALLQSGAAKVYAIDVGRGELAWKLRQDPRVVIMERTNARLLEELPEQVSLVSIDVSFISLKLILPQALKWLTKDNWGIIALIKPQFEAPPEMVGSGGVIVDGAVHRAVLQDLTAWAIQCGLFPCGLEPSPLKGAAGNKEFLLWLKAHAQSGFHLEQALQQATQDCKIE